MQKAAIMYVSTIKKVVTKLRLPFNKEGHGFETTVLYFCTKKHDDGREGDKQ